MKKMLVKVKKMQDFIDLFSGLSKQRLELLWQIKTLRPESVYELANTLQKSQPYIQKEVNFLAQKGLVALKKSKTDGRSRVKPEVNYQILSLEMDFQ
ncbi:MAG: hypothetical protein V4654_15485 [Bdellovibrionota bacterium]